MRWLITFRGVFVDAGELGDALLVVRATFLKTQRASIR
jgi:hypothetical protein